MFLSLRPGTDKSRLFVAGLKNIGKEVFEREGEKIVSLSRSLGRAERNDSSIDRGKRK